MNEHGVFKAPRKQVPSRQARVKCDGCSYSFLPQPYERDHVGDEGDGVRVYLQCPKCSRAYPSVDISGEGVRLREKLGTMRGQGREDTPKYHKVLKRYQAEVTRLGEFASA